jgi:hypothetical protein
MMDLELPRHLQKQLNRMPSSIVGLGDVASWVRAFVFDPKTGEIVSVDDGFNDRLFGGSDILARLIAGQDNYKPAAMYFEYENLGSPGDPIPAPSFERDDGIDYYLGLSGSPTKDFLRVPLVLNPQIVASSLNFNGNQVNFFAISEGTQGFHGKDFSELSNSEVYGAALVATPVSDTQGDDIVYARSYDFDQVAKDPGHQVGIQWFVRAN